MRISEPESVQELLSVTSGCQLESWLYRLEDRNILHDECYWRNVGNLHSNAGAIEASADPINPLVERIVNAFEAVIELHVTKCRLAPNSPQQAIEQIFGIPHGRTSELDEVQARELAQHVTVTFRGPRRSSTPTIEVRDRGIGLHPSEFSSTILALGQSTKGQKKYMIGMYGQGGSSTFDKCKYTIIVSRRYPQLLSDCQQDKIGWTIVRRSLNVRAPVYLYLVDPHTGKVPDFSSHLADHLESFYGTSIIHVEYKNTGGFATQYTTNNAWYTLNYRLFNPLLPWTLDDQRIGAPKNSSRTMRGVPYRLDKLPLVEGIGSSKHNSPKGDGTVRHHIQYRHELPSGSDLIIEWWILQDENVQGGHRRRKHHERTIPYRDRSQRYSQRVVAITRGGQMHAALTSNVFKKSGLRQLARSIIVQVDTDLLTFEEGASFFASNRSELKTQSQDLIEEALDAAINLHGDQLRAIEREREQEIVSGRGASDEQEIRKHLDPLIRAHQQQETGQGSATDRDRKKDRKFKGKQVPTYLEFARTTKMEIRPGVPTRVELLTDAANKVVRSRRTNFPVECSSNKVRIEAPRGSDGRYRIDIFPSGDLVIGSQFELSASLFQRGAWSLTTGSPRRVVVVAPPPPYVGNNPPSYVRFRSQNGSVQVRPGKARITILTDACNSLTEEHATLEVDSPDPISIPIVGKSGPTNGEYRVLINIPETVSLGDKGEIKATLTLKDGSTLSDRAKLVVAPKLKRGGQASPQSQPNYEIRDVTEIRSGDDGVAWEDMPEILDVLEPWNNEDVGAFLETEEHPDQKKIIFYLNVDNRELREIERKIARRQSEKKMDTFRIMHRTLLCFHLHSLATRSETNSEDYWYREEIRRVSKTLLYTHEEFMHVLNADEEA